MGSIQSREPKKNTIMKSNDCDFIKTLDFLFHDDVLENGLYFANIYIPEEVIIQILSYVPLEDIWKLRLVCKKWYNMTKSNVLWSTIFNRTNKKLPKKLPWYVCYKCLDNSILDKNLLKNNCGEEKFNHWIILEDGGHKLKVEETPVGCDPIPTSIDDFNGAKSCFVTSFTSSSKVQVIQLNGNLSKYIIKKFRPHLYVSEWYAGRFDCGGHYELKAALYKRRASEGIDLNRESNISDPLDHEILIEKERKIQFEGNEAVKWQKVEILFENYPDDIEGILFEHKARDNQFWAGHYGTKMAGGVVKFKSDTIDPNKSSSMSEDMD